MCPVEMVVMLLMLVVAVVVKAVATLGEAQVDDACHTEHCNIQVQFGRPHFSVKSITLPTVTQAACLH